MIHSFRLSPDGIYRCDAFQEFIWQSHGFGTVNANPTADVTLRQIHSNHVLNATGLKDREAEGDALVSDQVGVSIAVRTADCVPILLLDSSRRAVAAVHAGWRGTVAEVVKCTVQQMSRDFSTKPADLFAAIGPCIRGCCYDVGEDVARQFVSIFPEWGADCLPRKIDLADANRRQMETAGIAPDRIFDSCFCTMHQAEQFYSYRREPANPGRLLASISRLS